MQDDISAMDYNPRLCEILVERTSLLLLSERLTDDAHGNFLIGTPLKQGALGFSAAYYDGGKIDVFDAVTNTEKSMDAKKDLILGTGYGWGTQNIFMGISGKYISSELVGNKTATVAGDAGVQYGVSRNLSLGAAFQNFGGKTEICGRK